MDKNFKTKKQFGQHLLISKDVITKIVDTLDIKEEDNIIEIGVGTGHLTEEILSRNPSIVYGIEIDKAAYPIIEEKFKDYRNFELIKADFFDVDLKSVIGDKKVKFTGNLPYNVASNIIIKTVYFLSNIKLSVFMVQKEVAEKIIAKPRSKNCTFFSVFIQTFYKPEYIMSVPARFFYPPPKVTSGVIKLIPKEKIQITDIDDYREFLSKLFQNRRKMLRTKIDTELLKSADINPESRVEELNLEHILKLYEVVKSGDR
ncbi:MAG: 16S rRNA (adenine(1518)-N(6)/adenine(1519)-N(6))-dimethyltransferase RsmA [Hydrogenothermaceae bacterium]|nr:16S rRNA (adenine(1518)-N(6)/adenine(1519)-N(6))-dimethyltransferase RsmA [Hydrogenothermaceae bacterium]